MPALRPVLLGLALLAAVSFADDAQPRLHLRKDVLQEQTAAHAAGKKGKGGGGGDEEEDHEFRSLPGAASPSPSPTASVCDPLSYEGCNLTPIPGAIINHRGPVVTAQLNVYVIFYGAWSAAQQVIVTDFLTGFGATPYYAMLSQYGVNGGLVLAKTVTNCYSQTRSLNPTTTTAIISGHVTKQELPLDVNGLYLILADPTVQHPTLKTACGWHNTVTVQSKKLMYAFVGNPLYRLNGCVCFNMHSSPNGDIGIDGLINPMAHEIVEVATDPFGTAWFDGRGNENADKCAYNFGTPYQTANGAWANMHIGQRDFLVQTNWHPTSNACVMG